MQGTSQREANEETQRHIVRWAVSAPIALALGALVCGALANALPHATRSASLQLFGCAQDRTTGTSAEQCLPWSAR
uniref:hypothetical protein n=1 Tax=unclassified Variovorax TaxID=663243 RepID=UPI000D36583B